MARPKKTDTDVDNIFSLKTSELLWMRDKGSGARQAPRPAMASDDAEIPLDAAFFAHHKSQFISGLSNLESGVHELRRAYISHFNTLLPDGHPGRLSLPFFTSFDNNAAGPLGNVQTEAAPAAGAVVNPAAAAAAIAAAGAEANSKKKRKPHDPNAPKRALTSYFLFMQHNKPQIKETHPEWDAKAVAEESERRWNNISEQDKQKYEYMYQVDLARYYRQKEAYESGEPVPEIDAEEATRLYNEHLATGMPFKGRKGKKLEGVAPPPSGNAPAAAATSESEEEEEEQAAPPPKNKRQRKEEPKPTPKSAAQAKKFKEIVPPKSPEATKKKGGRKSKAAEETPVVEEPAAPSPKKEKKGRKRKSAAVE